MPNSDVKEIAIDPPNIRTNPVKKGKVDSVVFSKPTYNAIGDPFKEAAQAMLRKQNREQEIKVGNEKPFRLPSHVRQPTNASYPHMQDFVEVKKNFKSEENPREVMIGPRNFLTNPPKTGTVGKNTTFGGTIPHMAKEDEYNRPKMLAREEVFKNQDMVKRIHDNKPFSQKVRQTSLFNSTKNVIGEDIAIPAKPPRKKTPPPMTHEKPFKPSNPPKQGQTKMTLAPFPEYKENPFKHVERKVEEDNPDKKQFRPAHNYKSRPTPSIQTNMRNLKASFPSVFKR